MLACAQDLFFNNDKSLPRPDSFQPISSSVQQQQQPQQQQQQQQQPQQQQRTNTSLQHMKLGKKSHMNSQHPSEKDKEEQVWPPEVEASFIEALETIPKLGRRKILVNGKPCGRNELISDFIFRKTSKVRTRKQVSSHIQVLKNTRKNDPHFMRLLTDSMDLEDEFVHRKIPKTTSSKRPQQKHHHQRQQRQLQQPSFFHHQHYHHNTSLGKLATSSSISSDESSIHSSPSPADYVFDMMHGDDHALSMLDMKDPFYDTLHHPLFDTTTGMLGNDAPTSQPSTSSSSLVSGLPSRFTDLATTSNTAQSSSSSAGSPSCFGLLPMDATNTTSPSVSSSGQLLSLNNMGGLQQTDGMEQQNPPSYYPYQEQHHYNGTPAIVEQLTPSCKWEHGNNQSQENSNAPPQQHKWKENYPPQQLQQQQQQYINHRNVSSAPIPSIYSLSASYYLDQVGQGQSTEVLSHPHIPTGMPFSTNTTTADHTHTIPMTTMPPPSYNAPLWPSYLCLYLEHTSAAAAAAAASTSSSSSSAASTLESVSASSSGYSHTLVQLPHCFPATESSQLHHSSTSLKKRYHSLMQIHPSLSSLSSDVTLFAKMKLDLNFNMDDFFFNNTCFFESKDRRMIECTTTIYSFGNIVLESKEMQQALWIGEDKYLYNFVFVNQFFDAFMKGIRSLQSWDEVDIAIHNLCIIQVFEDMEVKCQAALDQETATTLSNKKDGDSNHDLLALVYEFERGQGTIEMTSMRDAL
ncbi:TEA/ATTS domain family-domain-containing protein [Absidia repens]|uniref:TEA/ATTS domain family-domain-containing protein n=1 Tax=Absidia repens TaxID=90262 RepID=A0A1X2IJT1_9FUNG|nr:TEA/ATTS domain family-domain-containing protein [Absidia repens]